MKPKRVKYPGETRFRRYRVCGGTAAEKRAEAALHAVCLRLERIREKVMRASLASSVEYTKWAKTQKKLKPHERLTAAHAEAIVALHEVEQLWCDADYRLQVAQHAAMKRLPRSGGAEHRKFMKWRRKREAAERRLGLPVPPKPKRRGC